MVKRTTSLNYPLLKNTIKNYADIRFGLREKVFLFKGKLLESYDFESFQARSRTKSRYKAEYKTKHYGKNICS